MHLLPGVLSLLLAAGSPAAAAPGLRPFAGAWKGPVTVTPGGCVWDVSGAIKELPGGRAAGSFSYSGPCGSTPKLGSFSGKQRGYGCYAVAVSIPGLPALPVTACLGPADTLTFDSTVVKGTLKLSEGNSRADLKSASLTGGAEGTFRRTDKKPGRDGKGGKNAHGKVDAPEILIGGY